MCWKGTGYVGWSQSTAINFLGSNKTAEGGGMNYGNISVLGSRTMNAFNMNDNANTALTVNTGATLELIPGEIGLSFYVGSSLKILQSATVSGGTLTFNSGSGIPVQNGIMKPSFVSMVGDYSATRPRLAPAIYSGSFSLVNTTNAATFTFGTGTTTFKGITVFAATNTGASLTADLQRYNAQLVFEGGMIINDENGGDAIWHQGTNPLILSGSSVLQGIDLAGSPVKDILVRKKNAGSVFITGNLNAQTVHVESGSIGVLDNAVSTIDINGDLILERGNFTFGNQVLTLSGDLLGSSKGILRDTNASGSMILDGGDQTITGSNLFSNLQKAVTSPHTLTFAATSEQTITNSLTLHGATGNLLSIRSTTDNLPAKLNLNSVSTQDIHHVDVKDNTANDHYLYCYIGNVYGEGCKDSGNTDGWKFGYVFIDAHGLLGIGDLVNRKISYTVNGGPVIDSGFTSPQVLSGALTLSESGTVVLSGATLHDGDILTVFFDDDTEKGASIVRTTIDDPVTGVYDTMVALTSYTTAPITNADIALADNNGDSDITRLYSVVGSELRVKKPYLTAIFDGEYKPGGSVRLADGLYIQGDFSMDNNPVTLSGSWVTIGGSFTGTNLVTFDSAPGDNTLNSDGYHFYNVQIGKSSTPGGNIDVTSDLVMEGSLTGSGNVRMRTQDATVRIAGNVDMGAAMLTMGSGSTWFVDGNWSATSSGNEVAGFGNNWSPAATLVMDGIGKTLNSNALANLSISGAVTLLSDTLHITRRVTVPEFGGLTLSGGTNLAIHGEVAYSDGDVRLAENAGINGAGTLTILSGASISQNLGFMMPALLHVIGDHSAPSSRLTPGFYTSALNVFEESTPGNSSTVTFDSGTYAFDGITSFSAANGAVYTIDASTNSPLIGTFGSLMLGDPATNGVVHFQNSVPLLFYESSNAELSLSGSTMGDIAVQKTGGSLTITSSGSIDSINLGSGSIDQNGQSLTVGTLEMGTGTTYDVHGGTLSLTEDLLNHGGTFTDDAGLVRLTGTDQQVIGNNTFYDFTKIASGPGELLVLGAGNTQTVNGTLTLQGDASNHVLRIISTATGSQAAFDLDSLGTQIIDHVRVMNNSATGQDLLCYITSEGCQDDGQNSHWIFSSSASSSSSSATTIGGGGTGTPGGGSSSSASSASSSSSSSSISPIDRLVQEVTGSSASILLTRPPDPPAGCDLKVMEFRLGATQYFFDANQSVYAIENGLTSITHTVEIPAPAGDYIQSVFYAGINGHQSSFRVLGANGNILGYYSFDHSRDGENISRKVDYINESVRSLRWTQGSPEMKYHWTAAYMCPLSLHGAPPPPPPDTGTPGVPPNSSGSFTVPSEFPIIDPTDGSAFTPPDMENPFTGSPLLNPDDFLIDENGNIISVDGKFLIDRDGNILNYDDLLRSVTGSLLLKQMRTLHFASLLNQGGLSLFYKPLSSEQLELLKKLLKRPLVSVTESDYLPNPVLAPLIDAVMRNPTEDNWNALMAALTPDVENQQAEKNSMSFSVISDAIARGTREFMDFTRTAALQFVLYPARLAGYGKNTTDNMADALPPLYESKLRPNGSVSELAVFHLRFVSAYGTPLAHVPVLLFSVPKFTTTDNEGIATFFDVPAGIHRIEAHLDDGRIETRMVTIRPPTNVRLTEPVDTVLPLADVVIPESNDLRTNPDIFPPLAYLLMTLVIGGTIYVRRRRKKGQEHGEEPAPEQNLTTSSVTPIPGVPTQPL